MQPQKIYLKDYQRSDFLIETVTIQFDLYESHTRVTNEMVFYQNKEIERISNDLSLDGDGLEILSLKIMSIEDSDASNGEWNVLKETEYSKSKNGLKICHVPEKFKLQVVTKIFPEKNTSCEGLYKSDGFYVTQNEAQGFRKITYFLDRPDVMSLYKTVITADKEKYPVLLSNGNLLEEKTLQGGRHQVVWEDPFKKPCYLYALVAGDMGMIRGAFVTKSGRHVDLRIYSNRGNEDRCSYAMESLQRSMKWDEERFGLEYDLDIYMIVAVNSFNAGAMENKGLNIFNASYVLVDSQTATDSDFRNVEAVVGHEYFHNWTGNRITLRDWFQLSLKEGLTVFRDQEFVSDLHSRSVKRIDDAKHLRNSQFAEDAGPMAHPVRPESVFSVDNLFSLTIYEKGAELIRMLYTFLGREGFCQGIGKYVELYDGQAVTTDNFIHAMELSSGREFSQFCRWYSQAGTPKLSVQGDYNEKDQVYTLEMEQSCESTPDQPGDLKEPFYFPLSMGLLGEDGEELNLVINGKNLGKEATLTVSERRHLFKFEGVKRKPIPSFLREFSSPIHLEFNYSDDELSFLMVHEKDSFVQWEAMQELTLRVLREKVDPLRDGSGETEALASYLQAYGALLKREDLDLAYKAQLIELPNLSYLAETIGWHHLERVCEARVFLSRALFEIYERSFLDIYSRLNIVNDYDLSHAEIGRRSLKKCCLQFLLEGSESYNALGVEQFKKANNMTDKLSALSALSRRESSEASKLREEFYNEYKGKPLVFNKFLKVVAHAESTGLDELREVAELPEFDMNNPNCVHSLFHGFASQNIKSFHNGDNDCYGFFVNLISDRDRENAHVGSRLASVFNIWKKLSIERQERIEPLLKGLIDGGKLSSNSYEIISKSFP